MYKTVLSNETKLLTDALQAHGNLTQLVSCSLFSFPASQGVVLQKAVHNSLNSFFKNLCIDTHSLINLSHKVMTN